MASLLRIGQRYINLDLVTHIEGDDATRIRIRFSSDNGDTEPLKIIGAEASALLRWLRLNSSEVISVPKGWKHVPALDMEPQG